MHPVLGGNKWFKLQKWFEREDVEAAPILSSMGGPWSNHLVAFAEMCFLKNKKPQLWLRAEMPTRPNARIRYLLDRGAEFRPLSREAYRKLREFSRHPENPDIPFLPEGGFSEEAVFGVEKWMPPLTHGMHTVFCAAGTGTTAAGLIRGAAEGTHVAVFPAVLAEEQIKENILRHLGPEENRKNSFCIVEPSPRLRFGKITEEIKSFTAAFERDYGIPLDPVYNARMMINLLKGPGRKYLEEPVRCVWIHTGGLFIPEGYD
jgi:1-aminocyclopropane-1-carboxylate deaminase